MYIIRTKRLILVVLASVLLAASWPASPAHAHAKLLKTSPEAGSILDAQPTEIQISLSESVGLEFSTITLYDRARKEHPVGDLGRVGDDEATAAAPIAGELAPGVYTVVWRVLSTIDGHVTAGRFAFRIRGAGGTGTPGTVGTPEPEEPIVPLDEDPENPFEGSAENPDPLRWLVRALIFAAAVLLVGGSMLTIMVIEPTVAKLGDAGTVLWVSLGRRFSKIGAVCAAVLLPALVLDLLLQVALIGGTDLLGVAARRDLALQVLSSTAYGFTWAVKALAAVALLGLTLHAWLWNRRGDSGVWMLTLAAGSLLFLAQSLGSHAAAVAGSDRLHGLPSPVLNDWLHLVVVAAWVGGLGYMALVLFPTFRALSIPAEERRDFLGRAVPRFSRLALVSVAILAITGTYNLLIHSTDLGAILSSSYGQVLALKIGVFVVLVAVGAVNLRRLSPMLRAQAEPPQEGSQDTSAANRAVPGLGRNIRIEVALAVLALVFAGGLTLLPPPGNATSSAPTASQATDEATPASTDTTVAQPPTPIPTPQPASADTNVAGYGFSLMMRPSLEGDEVTLNITRTAETSPPLTDVDKVLFKVTPQDIDAGSTSYEAQRDGDAGADRQTWKANESILTLDGDYLITAIVRRTQSSDLKAAFQFDLSVENGLSASVGYVVDMGITTEPSPPISGTGIITITLSDGARAPIEGAKVTVNPIMPAHAHVEPTAVAAPVEGKPGAYSFPIHFDMSGAWLFIFNTEREGFPPVKSDASLEVIDPNATPTPQESLSP